MDKNKEYELVKDFPGRNIGDIIYWAEEPVERWFWKTGGCIPPDLTRDLQGLPKLEDWFEEVEELCVPVGTKFKHEDNNGLIYTISEVIDNTCFITWLNHYGNIDSIDYNVKFVNRLFAEGMWIEYKEPKILFTTEDGVAVKSSEQLVWIVKEKKDYLMHYKKASNAIKMPKIYGVKIFNDKYKAQEYVELNKPLLSYNDVSKLIIQINNEGFYESFCKDLLTKLVKSKL